MKGLTSIGVKLLRIYIWYFHPGSQKNEVQRPTGERWQTKTMKDINKRELSAYTPERSVEKVAGF